MCICELEIIHDFFVEHTISRVRSKIIYMQELVKKKIPNYVLQINKMLINLKILN